MTQTQAWHEERMTGLGGSDAAPALGLCPPTWTDATPLGIYNVKTGVTGPKRQTFPMRRGSACEREIIELFSERFEVEVETGLDLVRHPDRAHIFCHPDGQIIGGKEGIEAKNVGWPRGMVDGWGENGTDQVPIYYECQGRHNMAVMGWDRIHFPVWFSDTDAYFVMERDLDLERDMMDRLDSFWFDHVVAGVPPEPASLAEAVAAWPKAVVGKTTEATPEVLDRLASYEAARDSRLCQSKIEKEHAEWLAIYMEDAEAIVLPDNPAPLFTRKTTKRKGYTVDESTYRTPRLTKAGTDVLAARMLAQEDYDDATV